MPQIVPPTWKRKIQHFFLDLDARIDSTLFSSAKGARELYERYSTFMDRFYVGRWKRWVFIEPLSEAATIGLGGMILMLALAVPAFRETADEDWLKKSDLAVTFLDRYGTAIGSQPAGTTYYPYPWLHASNLAPVAAAGLRYRLTEANDYLGGVPGASNAFASALWALDYLHW